MDDHAVFILVHYPGHPSISRVFDPPTNNWNKYSNYKSLKDPGAVSPYHLFLSPFSYYSSRQYFYSSIINFLFYYLLVDDGVKILILAQDRSNRRLSVSILTCLETKHSSLPPIYSYSQFYLLDNYYRWKRPTK